MTEKSEYILTISCKDISGIVAAVSGFIAKQDCFIIESNQFGDSKTGQFFQRIHFRSGDETSNYVSFKNEFTTQIANVFNMDFNLHDLSSKPKVLLMVSKFGHCLNDILHRHQTGSLNIDIPAVISNHPDMQRLVEWHNIPYFHLPLEKNKKPEQEAQIIDIIDKHDIDLTVLARYMQILSPELCKKLHGKAINIHHSFLPSFKGAKPYHQAHARGVKLIGATAHYVTSNLDEGPIIEQEVRRVDHTYSPEDFVATGQDIESRVLSRAVKYHCEHRVLLNDNKTIVF